MAITVEEKYGSVKAGADFVEAEYLVKGTDDEAAARAALLAAAPTTRAGLDRKGESVEVTETENERWTGVVRWEEDTLSSGSGGGTDNVEIEGDIGGGTEHITHSLASGTTYPSGAPTSGGALNVSSDGTVGGIDKGLRAFNFQVRKIFAASSVDSSYLTDVFNLTFTVNNGSFTITDRNGIVLSFNAGELLFTGATFGPVRDSKREVVFKFSASPNRTGVSVGSITGVAVKGWEYLNVRYVPSQSNNGHVMVASSVTVEQIYEEGDFMDLSI